MYIARLLLVGISAFSLSILPTAQAVAFDDFYAPYGHDSFLSSTGRDDALTARLYFKMSFSGERRVKTPPSRFGLNLTSTMPQALRETTFGGRSGTAALMDFQFGGNGSVNLWLSGLPAFRSRLYADGMGNTERESEFNWTYVVLGVLAAGGLAIALTSGGDKDEREQDQQAAEVRGAKAESRGKDASESSSSDASVVNDTSRTGDGDDEVGLVPEQSVLEDGSPEFPDTFEPGELFCSTANPVICTLHPDDRSQDWTTHVQGSNPSLQGVVTNQGPSPDPTTVDEIPPSTGPVPIEPISTFEAPIVITNTLDFTLEETPCLGLPGVAYVDPDGGVLVVDPGGC